MSHFLKKTRILQFCKNSQKCSVFLESFLDNRLLDDILRNDFMGMPSISSDIGRLKWPIFYNQGSSISWTRTSRGPVLLRHQRSQEDIPYHFKIGRPCDKLCENCLQWQCHFLSSEYKKWAILSQNAGYFVLKIVFQIVFFRKFRQLRFLDDFWGNYFLGMPSISWPIFYNLAFLVVTLYATNCVKIAYSGSAFSKFRIKKMSNRSFLRMLVTSFSGNAEHIIGYRENNKVKWPYFTIQ
jgi:hypothetical protein